uniref:Rhodanese domain-containing protein n=1 Tax=Arundo donax TaxID=35708 RepID=A0A0A9GCQ4_ARUDO
MATPNLRIVDKSAMQVEFNEEHEEGFVREVLARFPDPANTIVCVLDNFDVNSLKVAELLFKNGFKEAYAIEGGLRGPEGWQAVQENYLPPSVHVFPREKKSKKLAHTDVSTDGTNGQQVGSGEPVVPNGSIVVDTGNGFEDGHENPNYPDLKPPSSPTPSKPES